MNIKNKNIEFLAIMVNKKIKFDRITLLMISKQKKKQSAQCIKLVFCRSICFNFFIFSISACLVYYTKNRTKEVRKQGEVQFSRDGRPTSWVNKSLFVFITLFLLLLPVDCLEGLLLPPAV